MHSTFCTRAAAAVALALLGASLNLAHAQAVADPYNYKRTISFTYQANGMLATETVEPDTPQQCVVTTHSYDAYYGNKTGASTSNCAGASGLALFDTRQSASTYGVQTADAPSGRLPAPAGTFATSSKVALTANIADSASHTESREFDPRFGAVTKLIGPNGAALATTWGLDEFGRKVLEVRADGTRTVMFHCLLVRSFNGVAVDTSSNSSGCTSATATPVAQEAPALAVRYEHTEPRSAADQKIGAFARTYFDRAGRKIRQVTQAFDDPTQPGPGQRLVVQDTDYNLFDAAFVVTQPYFLDSGSSTVAGSGNYGMTRTDYDALGRSIASYTTDPTTATTAGSAGQTGGSQGSVAFGSRGNRQAARTRVAYDGSTITTTDDQGRTRIEERNPDGKVVRATDSLGAQVVHQHDAFGNLVQTKDPLGNTLVVAYDIRGRKLTLNDSDAGLTAHCYDALGQLKAQQTSAMRGSHAAPSCPDNSGAGSTAPTVAGWTTLTYDRLGRLVHRMEPEFGTTWSYDRYQDGGTCTAGIGKLCETRTTHGVTRKTAYDSYGRPSSSRADYAGLAGGAASTSLTSSVGYDSVTGRVNTQTYPSGLRVSMHYTPAGYMNALKLVTEVTVNPLPATPGGAAGAAASLDAGRVLWQAKSVNAWGKTELSTYANDVNNRVAFDPQSGRLQQLTAGKLAANDVVNQRLTWDSRTNQLWSRVDALGDGSGIEVLDTYQYDAIGRLEKYTVSGGSAGSPSIRTVDLQYNALGMLLYKSDAGIYTYPTQGVANGKPHAVQGIVGLHASAYTYDRNGNVVAATGGKYRSVTYTSFNLPDGGNGLAGQAGSPRYAWQYDESHARIVETRSNAHGTRTTWFLHPDKQGGLGFERELAPNGAQSNRHYLSAGGTTIGVIVTAGGLPTLAANQMAPNVLPIVTAVKVEFWHKDHQASLVATTDHNGNVTGRYAYDPFGKRRYTNSTYDPFGNVVIDWTSNTNSGTDRGYTGHEHLDDIGLVHMNGRIFDPTIARFMQPDPLVSDPLNMQAYDRYGYCGSNPLTCTDPSGYSWLSKTWKKLWNNKIVRTAIIVVVAYYAGSYALDAYANAAGQAATSGFSAAAAGNTAIAIDLEAAAAYSAGYSAAATSVTGGAIAGAAGGFTASFIGSNGDLKAGVRGAVSGAVSGGINNYYGSSYSWDRVGAETLGAGASARLTGGDWRRAMGLQLGISSLTYANWSMRQEMIAQSSINPDNISGESAGFLRDGRKVGGGRHEFNPLWFLSGEDPGIAKYMPCVAPMGGCQGTPMFGGDDVARFGFIKYGRGGLMDTIVETFSGPHDWFRNLTGSYTASGNSVAGLTGWNLGWDTAKNYLLVLPAGAFAIPGMLTTVPGAARALGGY